MRHFFDQPPLSPYPKVEPIIYLQDVLIKRLDIVAGYQSITINSLVQYEDDSGTVCCLERAQS